MIWHYTVGIQNNAIFLQRFGQGFLADDIVVRVCKDLRPHSGSIAHMEDCPGHEVFTFLSHDRLNFPYQEKLRRYFRPLTFSHARSMLAACCEHREEGGDDGQDCVTGRKVVNRRSDAYGFCSFGWQVLCASHRDLFFSPLGEGFS